MSSVLADSVLVLHFGVVCFVVGGLVAVLLGNWRHWRWVNAASFRYAHLIAIAFVVAQSWLGLTCPLTTLEAWLRMQGGDTAHGQGFIEHWVQRVLFYSAPGWFFGMLYTAFGALVALAWWRFPPAQPRRADRSTAQRDRGHP